MSLTNMYARNVTSKFISLGAKFIFKKTLKFHMFDLEIEDKEIGELKMGRWA